MIFNHCSDIGSFLEWHYGPEMKHAAFSIYSDSLIQKKEHNFFKESLQDLVTQEIGPGTMVTPEDIELFFQPSCRLSAKRSTLIEDINDVINDVLLGKLLIFFDQWNKALSYNAIGLETRQVTESVTEPIVQGPRESTVENLSKNLGMLRIKVKVSKF